MRRAILLIIVTVMLQACGSRDSGSADGSSTPAASAVLTPPADASSLPLELQGTWHDGSTTVAVSACAAGEKCGRLRQIDGNGEHCVYTLTYRSGNARGVHLTTSMGNSFGCGFSPWSKGVVSLSPGTDGTVEVAVRGVPQTAITLKRASGA